MGSTLGLNQLETPVANLSHGLQCTTVAATEAERSPRVAKETPTDGEETRGVFIPFGKIVSRI